MFQIVAWHVGFAMQGNEVYKVKASVKTDFSLEVFECPVRSFKVLRFLEDNFKVLEYLEVFEGP